MRRFSRNRPRLIVALALGVAIGLLAPDKWAGITRVMTGWNAGVWSYLFLMAWMMTRSSPEQVAALAEREDEGTVAVLAVMSIGAVVSIAAIVFELATTKGATPEVRFGHYLFTALTLTGSWCLVAVMFTFHYAQAFYHSPPSQRALRFPEGEDNPDYWDFLYLAFTIAVAAQTSDVSIMSREMRKTVLAQSVLSFVFNAAILGLSINIAAGAVGA
ncbi:DUF1345 domain-containing protein [Oxalobacteraceae bacterium OM1]|nr:DUF1345 domain-containing protein [Oxalobacteraceae bacterium OM1]